MHHRKNRGNKEIALAILPRILAQSFCLNWLRMIVLVSLIIGFPCFHDFFHIIYSSLLRACVHSLVSAGSSSHAQHTAINYNYEVVTTITRALQRINIIQNLPLEYGYRCKKKNSEPSSEFCHIGEKLTARAV